MENGKADETGRMTEEEEEEEEGEGEGCPQFYDMDAYEISHRCPKSGQNRTSMRCSSQGIF